MQESWGAGNLVPTDQTHNIYWLNTSRVSSYLRWDQHSAELVEVLGSSIITSMKTRFNSKVPTLHIIQPISRAALMSQPRGQNWFVIAMNTLDYFLAPLFHKLLEFSPLKSWPKIAHKWAFSRCAPTTALGSTKPIHTRRSSKTSLHNFPTTGRLADLTTKQRSTLMVFAFCFLKNSVTLCVPGWPWTCDSPSQVLAL